MSWLNTTQFFAPTTFNHSSSSQIWGDPHFPDAHRDPALRRWLHARAERGIAALIRFNERDAIAVFAPPFDAAGQWHEIDSGIERQSTHSFADIIAALGSEP